MICNLAKNKFLEGLKVILLAKHLENFKKENHISDECLDRYSLML